jgi:hypothetical protein
MGASVQTVEGVLQGDQDSAYAVRVASVAYLNGQSNQWNGEPLVIAKRYVSEVRERQFSKSRTLWTTAGVVGGAAAFIAAHGLSGSGTVSRDPGTPPPGGSSVRDK